MPEAYTAARWLIYFYAYSLFGWVFESAYVSIKKKKFVNRGFLNGPFLPIYGSGAVMMLAISGIFHHSLVLLYLAGMVCGSALELVTGMAMEAIFKVRYWDYSTRRFHYRGYICLAASLTWGAFTVAMNEVVHPWVRELFSRLDETELQSLAVIFGAVVLVDAAFSIHDAFHFRAMLVRAEELRREMYLLTRRADVVLACLDDDWKEFLEKNPLKEHAEKIVRHTELRAQRWKERKAALGYEPALPEEWKELRERFDEMREKHRSVLRTASRQFRRRMEANPSMRSAHYKLAFETWKEFLRREEETGKKEEK